MNTPDHIPSVPTSTLLIVSGSQVAELYHLKGRHLEHISSVKNTEDEYENRNYSSRPGTTYGQDISHENEQTIIRRDFDNELTEEVKKAISLHAVEDVYLFCPAEVSNEIREFLPQEVQKMLKGEIHGNYVKNSPLDLLEKLSF